MAVSVEGRCCARFNSITVGEEVGAADYHETTTTAKNSIEVSIGASVDVFLVCMGASVWAS